MQSSQVRNGGLPSSAEARRVVPAWTQDPKIFPLDWFTVSRPNIIRQTKVYVSELLKWRNCPKIKTLSKLKAVLKRIKMFLYTHTTYIDAKSLLECDLEEDLITLVSLYMDMELRVLLIKKSAISGLGNTLGPALAPGADMDTARNDKLVADRISYWLYTVLTGHEQRVDALLSTTVFTRHTRPVLDPLFRKILSEMSDGPFNSVNYVRHMLAYKTWRERALVADDTASEKLNARVLQHLVPRDFAFPAPLLRCLGKGDSASDHVRRHNVNLADACRNFMRFGREMPAAAAEQINFGCIPLLDDDMLGDEENEVNTLMNMISDRKQRKTTSPRRTNHQVDAFIDLTIPNPPTAVFDVIDLTEEDEKPVIISRTTAPLEPPTAAPPRTTSGVQRITSSRMPQPQPGCSYSITPSAPQVETRCFTAYRDQDIYLVNISCMCPVRAHRERECQCQDRKVNYKENKPLRTSITERKDATFVGRCFQFSIGNKYAYPNEDDVDTEVEPLVVSNSHDSVKLEMRSSATEAETRDGEFCDRLFSTNLNRCDCDGCKRRDSNLSRYENRTCSSADTRGDSELSDINVQCLQKPLVAHPKSVAEMYAMEKTSPIVLHSQPSTSFSQNVNRLELFTHTLDKRKVPRDKISKDYLIQSDESLSSNSENKIRKIKLPVIETITDIKPIRSEVTASINVIIPTKMDEVTDFKVEPFLKSEGNFAECTNIIVTTTPNEIIESKMVFVSSVEVFTKSTNVIATTHPVSVQTEKITLPNAQNKSTLLTSETKAEIGKVCTEMSELCCKTISEVDRTYKNEKNESEPVPDVPTVNTVGTHSESLKLIENINIDTPIEETTVVSDKSPHLQSEQSDICKIQFEENAMINFQETSDNQVIECLLTPAVEDLAPEMEIIEVTDNTHVLDSKNTEFLCSEINTIKQDCQKTETDISDTVSEINCIKQYQNNMLTQSQNVVENLIALSTQKTKNSDEITHKDEYEEQHKDALSEEIICADIVGTVDDILATSRRRKSRTFDEATINSKILTQPQIIEFNSNDNNTLYADNSNLVEEISTIKMNLIDEKIFQQDSVTKNISNEHNIEVDKSKRCRKQNLKDTIREDKTLKLDVNIDTSTYSTQKNDKELYIICKNLTNSEIEHLRTNKLQSRPENNVNLVNEENKNELNITDETASSEILPKDEYNKNELNSRTKNILIENSHEITLSTVENNINKSKKKQSKKIAKTKKKNNSININKCTKHETVNSLITSIEEMSHCKAKRSRGRPTKMLSNKLKFFSENFNLQNLESKNSRFLAPEKNAIENVKVNSLKTKFELPEEDLPLATRMTKSASRKRNSLKSSPLNLLSDREDELVHSKNILPIVRKQKSSQSIKNSKNHLCFPKYDDGNLEVTRGNKYYTKTVTKSKSFREKLEQFKFQPKNKTDSVENKTQKQINTENKFKKYVKTYIESLKPPDIFSMPDIIQTTVKPRKGKTIRFCKDVTVFEIIYEELVEENISNNRSEITEVNKYNIFSSGQINNETSSLPNVNNDYINTTNTENETSTKSDDSLIEVTISESENVTDKKYNDADIPTEKTIKLGTPLNELKNNFSSDDNNLNKTTKTVISVSNKLLIEPNEPVNIESCTDSSLIINNILSDEVEEKLSTKNKAESKLLEEVEVKIEETASENVLNLTEQPDPFSEIIESSATVPVKTNNDNALSQSFLSNYQENETENVNLSELIINNKTENSTTSIESSELATTTEKVSNCTETETLASTIVPLKLNTDDCKILVEEYVEKHNNQITSSNKQLHRTKTRKSKFPKLKLKINSKNNLFLTKKIRNNLKCVSKLKQHFNKKTNFKKHFQLHDKIKVNKSLKKIKLHDKIKHVKQYTDANIRSEDDCNNVLLTDKEQSIKSAETPTVSLDVVEDQNVRNIANDNSALFKTNVAAQSAEYIPIKTLEESILNWKIAPVLNITEKIETAEIDTKTNDVLYKPSNKIYEKHFDFYSDQDDISNSELIIDTSAESSDAEEPTTSNINNNQTKSKVTDLKPEILNLNEEMKNSSENKIAQDYQVSKKNKVCAENRSSSCEQEDNMLDLQTSNLVVSESNTHGKGILFQDSTNEETFHSSSIPIVKETIVEEMVVEEIKIDNIEEENQKIDLSKKNKVCVENRSSFCEQEDNMLDLQTSNLVVSESNTHEKGILFQDSTNEETFHSSSFPIVKETIVEEMVVEEIQIDNIEEENQKIDLSKKNKVCVENRSSFCEQEDNMLDLQTSNLVVSESNTHEKGILFQDSPNEETFHSSSIPIVEEMVVEDTKINNIEEENHSIDLSKKNKVCVENRSSSCEQEDNMLDFQTSNLVVSESNTHEKGILFQGSTNEETFHSSSIPIAKETIVEEMLAEETKIDNIEEENQKIDLSLIPVLEPTITQEFFVEETNVVNKEEINNITCEILDTSSISVVENIIVESEIVEDKIASTEDLKMNTHPSLENIIEEPIEEKKKIILQEPTVEIAEISDETCKEFQTEPVNEEKVQEVVEPFGPSVEMCLNVVVGLESFTFSQNTPTEKEHAKEGCVKCSVNGKHKDNKRIAVRGIHQYQQNIVEEYLEDGGNIPAIPYCQAVESFESNACTLSATVESVKISTNDSPVVDNYNLCILADIAMNSVHLNTKTENNNVIEVITENSNPLHNQSPLQKDERCFFVTFPEKVPVSNKPATSLSIINSNNEEVSVNVQKLAGGLNAKGIVLENKIQALTERAKNGARGHGENLDELYKSLENICELEINTLTKSSPKSDCQNSPVTLPVDTPVVNAKIPEQNIPIDIPNTALLHLTPDDDDFMMRNEPFSLQTIETSAQSTETEKKIDFDTSGIVKNLYNVINSFTNNQKITNSENENSDCNTAKETEPKTKIKKGRSKLKSSNNQSSETSYLLNKYKSNNIEPNKQNNTTNNKNTSASPPSYIRSTRPMRMVTTRKRNVNVLDNTSPPEEPAKKISASEKMFDKLLEEHRKELSESKSKDEITKEVSVDAENNSLVTNTTMPVLDDDKASEIPKTPAEEFNIPLPVLQYQIPETDVKNEKITSEETLVNLDTPVVNTEDSEKDISKEDNSSHLLDEGTVQVADKIDVAKETVPEATLNDSETCKEVETTEIQTHTEAELDKVTQEQIAEEQITDSTNRNATAIEVVQDWFNRVDNNKAQTEPYAEITSYQTIEECNFFEEISSTSENSPNARKSDEKVFNEHQTPDSGIAFDEDSVQKDKSENLSDVETETVVPKTYFCDLGESRSENIKQNVEIAHLHNVETHNNMKLKVSIALDRLKDLSLLKKPKLSSPERKMKKRKEYITDLDKGKKRKHGIEEPHSNSVDYQDSNKVLLKDFKIKKRKHLNNESVKEGTVEVSNHKDVPISIRTKGSVKEYPDCLFGITESPVPSGSFHSPYPSDISLTEEPTFYEEGGIDLCNDYPCYDSFEVLQEQQSLQREYNVVDDNPKDVQGLQAGYCVVDSQFLPLSEYMNDGDYILIDNKIFNDKRMVPVNMHQVQPETKPHNTEEVKRSEFDDSEKEDSLSETVDEIIKNQNLFPEQSTSEVQVISMDQATSEVQVVIACDSYQETDVSDTYLFGIALQNEISNADPISTVSETHVDLDGATPESKVTDEQVDFKPATQVMGSENAQFSNISVVPVADVPQPVSMELLKAVESISGSVIIQGAVENCEELPEQKPKDKNNDDNKPESHQSSESASPSCSPSSQNCTKMQSPSSPSINPCPAQNSPRIFPKPKTNGEQVFENKSTQELKTKVLTSEKNSVSCIKKSSCKEQKKYDYHHGTKIANQTTSLKTGPSYVSPTSQKSTDPKMYPKPYPKTYNSKVPADAFDKLKQEKTDTPNLKNRYRKDTSIPADCHRRHSFERDSPRVRHNSQVAIDSRRPQSAYTEPSPKPAYRLPPSDPTYRSSQYNYKKPEVKPSQPKAEQNRHSPSSTSRAHKDWLKNETLLNLIKTANTIYNKKY